MTPHGCLLLIIDITIYLITGRGVLRRNERPCTVWTPKLSLDKKKQRLMFFYIWFFYELWYYLLQAGSKYVTFKLECLVLVLYIIRGLFTFQAALRFGQKNPESTMFHTGPLSLCVLLYCEYKKWKQIFFAGNWCTWLQKFSNAWCTVFSASVIWLKIMMWVLCASLLISNTYIWACNNLSSRPKSLKVIRSTT